MERSAFGIGWSTLILAILLFSIVSSFASDKPDRRTATRAKLEHLLACQQAEKDAALAEKRRFENHISEVEAFRAELTEAPKHRLAMGKAEQALAKDRDGLAKAEERLRLADLQIRMTLNAMKYLSPPVGNPYPNRLETGKRLADFLAQFRREDSAAVDQRLEKENGFIEDPGLDARLGALLDRLQAASSKERVEATIRIVDKPTGRDAFATGTTIYFDKAYLDRLERRYTDPRALDDQLMVTMGHELAHIQLDHVNLGFAQGEWQRFQNSLWLRDREGSHEAYADPSNDHGDAAFRTQIAEYQRDQEYQADLLGAQQVLAAGVSPRSIKESFSRMWFDDLKRRLERHLDSDRKNKHDEPRYAKMIEDHARPDERLKALEEALGEKFWERKDLALPVPTCRHK